MKIKCIILSGIFSFTSFSVMYCQVDGQITKDMLIEFESTVENNPSLDATRNAVTNNDIKKLALNRESVGKIDNFFKYQVKSKGITDQKSSGRCWLYTGLNVLRSAVINSYNMDSFEFSENFPFFYDQLEKSNLFLEGIISTADKPMDNRTVEWLFRNPVGDGGQWTGVVDIIGKYGLVPYEVMPETYSSSNTSEMSHLIRSKLREFGLELREMHSKGSGISDLRNRKTRMLQDIYKLLVINLGNPPKTFSWRYKDTDGNISEMKEYTPLSFFRDFVHQELSHYVMLMNDPSRPYYKLYEIQYDRHIQEGQNWKYINLPVDEIKKFALLSLMDNSPMYFSCDVGKQLDKERGILDVNNFDYESLFGMSFGMDKKERIITGESSSSHGMALIGVDVNKKGNPTKWLLENSWGKQTGLNGLLIMTDAWFDEYMFRLVIDRKYVSDKTLKILDQKAVTLPPWDPMYMRED